MKRGLLTLGCAGLVAMTSATTLASADSSSSRVTGSNIDSVLLTADTVGDILGTNLPVQLKGKRPLPEMRLDQHQECSPLLDPGTKFYGSDLNLFRITVFKDDKDSPDYIVIQTVATYPDAQTAQTVFTKGIEATAGCSSVVQVTDIDSKPSWQLSAPKITTSDAKWHQGQLYQGDPVGWNCYVDMHSAENSILKAQVCQMGNAGPAVSQMMDQMLGGLPS
ncbi:sensor domain-containing protein [Mycobacterium paraterrae]|uniref:Sensor domain-containing protein n=1 Tax=Mycobacterium paraterrae TaxID=577492 RepID=A0ABY3VDH6_9MYCO|nr:sensor domain-containing protein [Mycobacterium paraterrae]UMB67463.1 sensor domain-containing protein [Mycobacterium paraterrae]